MGKEERWRKAHGQRSVQDDQAIQSLEQIGNTFTSNRNGKKFHIKNGAKKVASKSNNTEL